MANLEVIEDAIAKRIADNGGRYADFTLKSTGEVITVLAYGFNKRASQKIYTISNGNTVIKQGMRLYEVAQWFQKA